MMTHLTEKSFKADLFMADYFQEVSDLRNPLFFSFVCYQTPSSF